MKQRIKKTKGKKKHPLRNIGWGALLSVLLTAAIAILLLVFSEKSLSVGMGIVFAVLGILFLANTFLSGRAEILQLLLGVLGVAFSVWLFVDSESALSLLSYALAAILLFRAFLGFLSSFSAQRTGELWWKIQLIGSLLIAVFAIILFFGLFKSVRSMQIATGIFMLMDAVLELLSRLHEVFFARKHEAEVLPKKAEKEQKKSEKKN